MRAAGREFHNADSALPNITGFFRREFLLRLTRRQAHAIGYGIVFSGARRAVS